jgi:diacylglycerol kinase (ATP)
VEGLNTAVEKMADFIHPIFTKNWLYKDIAAGGIFCRFNSIAIGLIIYLHYFRNYPIQEWQNKKSNSFR